MTAPYLWHLWPSRHWPASVAEEAQFRNDLRTLAPAGSTLPTPARGPFDEDAETDDQFARANITAVLNALRCGMTLDELLAQLPGAEPAGLRAGYESLEARRMHACAAWHQLMSTLLTADAVVSPLTAGPDLSAATQLMPVPLHRIATRVVGTHGTGWHTAARAVSLEVAVHTRMSVELERALALRVPPDRQAVELGALLHNPLSPALWGSPYYLPRRLTDLSPTRVADLLDERTHSR